jgi:hypothetical protein
MSTHKVPLLQGLSASDRELMLVMMAALGSAAQSLMGAARFADDMQEQSITPTEYDKYAAELDAEANSLIDICKRAKDRLKPGAALLVN